MRVLAGKLGELDPNDDADRWMIWWCAVDEFLWPTSRHDSEHARITGHPMFFSWFSELGDGLAVIDNVLNFLYPECPPLDLFHGKESVRYSESGNPGGIAIAVDLDRLWEDSWISLVTPAQNGGPPIPRLRQSTRGLKFCLLALVLRLGVFDGSSSATGQNRLVAWGDAVDAASLQLALSIFWTIENSADFNPPVPPWKDIGHLAATKLSPSTENPKELKGHAEYEGIEGYRKRLRATMDEAAFRRVASLAAEFERQGSSGLEKWRNDSFLAKWFVVGRI